MRGYDHDDEDDDGGGREPGTDERFGNVWDGYQDEHLSIGDLTDAIDEIDPEALAELVRRAQGRRIGRGIAHDEWRNVAELREVARRLVSDRASKQALPALRRAVDPWRMCQTQVCLSLAFHLLQEDLVTSDVTVAISGREVTRTLRPTFDIQKFMRHRGGTTVSLPPNGCCRYAFRARRFGVVIVRDTGDGDVLAELAPGCRLIVYATPGPLRDTQSSREHSLLRNAIGVAVARADVTPLDVVAVAVPRSPRMRQIVSEMRAAPRVVAAGLSLVTVAQAGAVDGLPLMGRYVPPPWGESAAKIERR
jgi:hypothetical protein